MNEVEARDLDFMGAALRLARRGLGNTGPNPAVGCILVKDGFVVGRGWTQAGGRPHAEVQALTQACDAARGATAYVTLEPCAHMGVTPPCAKALVQAKIARVVVAITDPDPRVSGKGIKILKRAGINVTEGVGLEEAWWANLGFFLARTENRPLFTLKLATDAMGLIPGPSAHGESKWITAPEARAQGHRLRANHDAVLFGIGTVLADDPTYTCRLARLESLSPVRVLLDSDLRLPSQSNLLQTRTHSPLWIVVGSKADADRKAKFQAIDNVAIISAPDEKPTPEWVAHTLAERGLTRVLIESGPTLVNAFLRAGLVDEVAWFRSQRHLGSQGVPAFCKNMLEKLAFERQAVLLAGPDQLELYAHKA